MTGSPLHTGEIRAARRRRKSRRPATRTLARVSFMVSLPGASLLVATGGHVANVAARSGPGHPDHPHKPPSESPLVAMRRMLMQPHTAPAPTTTTTAPAPDPAPSAPAVATVSARVPPPPPAPRAGGILPPNNPPANRVASPPYQSICLNNGFSSLACVSSTIQATDNARSQEGLGPVGLPSNYSALTPGEQLFVMANIERVSRGLPPAVGLVNEFDQDAQAAANSNSDPTPSAVPPGVQVLRWASNWDENTGPLGSNYGFMYDDGPGSGNLACGPGGGGGCWGHRDNILMPGGGGTLVMGAAEAAPGGDHPWLSDTQLLAVVAGNPYYVYTWAQAVAAGAY